MATKKRPKERPRPRRQPETLRLRKLTPSFTATDLRRSMAFYRDVLGLSELKAGDHWVWFDFGLRRRDARPSLVDRAPTRG